MDVTKESSIMLVVHGNLSESDLQEYTKGNSQVKFMSSSIITETNASPLYDEIVYIYNSEYASTLLAVLIRYLKPSATFRVVKVPQNNVLKLGLDLKVNGFIDVQTQIVNGAVEITSKKPSYELGSSTKLNLTKKAVSAVWKLEDTLEDDLIDPDNLLDESDLKKPDPSSLRVCGTTGKRKACKDCSCGLADELAAEAATGKVINTSAAPKSSCGSCYLGDAFRCATCPYLGMPAFKPGEKIQLNLD